MTRKKRNKPSKEEALRVMNEVEELDLSDGAHWMLIHERLGLEYGDFFSDYIGKDPAYFGFSGEPD